MRQLLLLLVMAILLGSCTSRSEMRKIEHQAAHYELNHEFCIKDVEWNDHITGRRDVKYHLFKNERDTGIFTYHSTHASFDGDVSKDEIIGYLLRQYKKKHAISVFKDSTNQLRH